MSRVPLVVLTALSLLAAAVPSVMAAERTPPGSYLVYRATTVKQLDNQLMNNSVVKARYCQHFKMSADQIGRYFTQNLTLLALKSPVRTQSWYIDKSGKITVKSKLLPKGTMVFATKDGEPILAWSCGNPLRASLPGPKVAKAKSAPAQTAMMSQLVQLPQNPPEVKVLANPIETISTAAVTAPPAPAVVAAAPVAAPPVVAAVAAPSVAIAPAVAAASHFGLGWLGALGGLGGLAMISQGGSSNSSTPVITPEPSSMAAMAMGFMFVPVAWRVKRSRGRR